MQQSAGTPPRPELIIALDLDTLDEALDMARTIGPEASWFKIGKQLFTRTGPSSVRALKDMGAHVFLDLKFHDIPNTVAQAVRAAADIGADMVNVHASGGPTMLRAAAEAAADAGVILVAVTVLTSLDRQELASIGIDRDPLDQVLRLATLARDAGLHGVVCSPREINALRQSCGRDFVLVTPGIRPASSALDDQKRVMTPAEAARAGADYIVVGRPITRSDDPAGAAAEVRAECRLG